MKSNCKYAGTCRVCKMGTLIGSVNISEEVNREISNQIGWR